tara:strand:- start:342 stop:647 length:306 start_codon:yes stop_codon:yes gene_type:complete
MKTNYQIKLKGKDLFLNHLRGIEIKYLAPTNYKGSRVKIYDTRHEVSKIISYDYSYNNARDIGIEYLLKRGIEIDSMTYNEKTHIHTILTKDFATSIKEGK